MNIPTKEEFQKALIKRHGEKLFKRFSNTSVAICGLGGLGSNIAIILARAGIGKLHLIDFDRVDLSNLHRQQYALSQLGMYKTDALFQSIKSISPYTEITTDAVCINEDNIISLLSGADIICEAFDNAESKAMLVNNVLEHFPDKYIISASGMAGIASCNSIKTRKVTSRFYLCGDGESEVSEETSLFSSRVTACAAHQAHMILRILAGENNV